MELSPEILEKPWEELAARVAGGDAAKIDELLWALAPAERGRALDHLDRDDRLRLLTLLPAADTASLLEDLAAIQAADLLQGLSPATAGTIVEAMRSDRRADLLANLKFKSSDAILREVAPMTRENVRKLMTYPPDTAGGLMLTEFLCYEDGKTVAEILADMQVNGEKYSDYDVQYAYIVTGAGKLLGVLRLRDLLFSPKVKSVRDLMIPNPHSVRAGTTLDELKQFFDEHRFFGVPVVSDTGELVGVLRRGAVEEATLQKANNIYLKLSGIIGGEELRSMPLKVRAGRRLGWLSLNILLNMVSASVVAIFQNTLEQVIALAVFLPIISDMSGCSGNQAVAVSIRELSMGLLKPREFLRVFWKESAVGILNGLALGALLALVAFVWKGNLWLALVVGVALALNTLLAVLVGSLLPLLLKAMRLDPALVSGPLLTTVTDMCGFFWVLGFASAILPRLLGT